MVMLLIDGPSKRQLTVPTEFPECVEPTISPWDQKSEGGITISRSVLSIKLAVTNISEFDFLPNFDQIMFDGLANQWEKESASMSSIQQMSTLDSYQCIIAMGAKGLPLILRRMKNEMPEPDMWFWALEKIAKSMGLKPPTVPVEAIADSKMIAGKWFEWAYKHDIQW